MSSSRVKARAAVTAALVAVASVGAGVAWGAIPEADGTINACYKSSDGSLRVIDAANGQQCKKNETPVAWDADGGSVELADGAVTTPKIADGAVTFGKLAAGSVRGGHDGDVANNIQDGSVVDADIAGVNGSKITGALSESATIMSSNISGVIDATKIGSGITTAQILNGTITAEDLAGSDDVVPGAVTSEKILDGTIQSRDIKDGAVGLTHLGAGVTAKFVALEDRIEDLASPTEGTDQVHTQKLTGAVVATVPTPGAPLLVSANSRQQLVLPVTDIQVGDFLAVSPPTMNDPLLFAGAAITAPGLVTVTVYNPSAGAVGVAGDWVVNWMDLTAPLPSP